MSAMLGVLALWLSNPTSSAPKSTMCPHVERKPWSSFERSVPACGTKSADDERQGELNVGHSLARTERIRRLPPSYLHRLEVMSLSLDASQ